MTRVDFRQIEFEDGSRKCETLFRASISAFCSIPRPTRNEIAQVDDLAIGLYDSVSREARRYAANVLSKCSRVPPQLLQSLTDEPVEISAPLLIGSQALTDVDLVTLISKHGLPHAQVIARRSNINPAITNLVRLLNAKAVSEFEQRESRTITSSPILDTVRDRLRSFAKGSDPHQPVLTAESPYMALRSAALATSADAFPTAIAKALDLTQFRAYRLCTAITYGDLLIGLKSLDFDEEQAFFILAASYPSQIFHSAAMRMFLERYRATTPAEAAMRLQEWRKQDAIEAEHAHATQPAAISR